MKKQQMLVIELIKELAVKYPEMSFSYGYEAIFNEHMVEVQPKESYDREDYLLDEGLAYLKFVRAFPAKGLRFISDDPYVKVSKPIYSTKHNNTGTIQPKSKISQPILAQHNSATRSSK